MLEVVVAVLISRSTSAFEKNLSSDAGQLHGAFTHPRVASTICQLQRDVLPTGFREVPSGRYIRRSETTLQVQHTKAVSAANKPQTAIDHLNSLQTPSKIVAVRRSKGTRSNAQCLTLMRGWLKLSGHQVYMPRSWEASAVNLFQRLAT